MKGRPFLHALYSLVPPRLCVVSVVLAAMIVLAGCATSASNGIQDAEYQPPETIQKTPPSSTPDPAATSSQAAQEEVAEAAEHIQSTHVSPETEAELQSSLSSLFATLPENKTERDQKVTEIATNICNDFQPVNITALSTVGGYHEETYKLVHAVTMLNREFNADLDVHQLETQMRKTRHVTSTASKYAPVIGAYNRFYGASCSVKRGEPGSKEDFYIATAALTAEIVLAEQQVFYKTSFRATGVAANKLSLMKIRGYCDCYSLVLHQVHWAFRGTMIGAKDYAIQKGMENGIELSEDDVDSDEIEATMQRYYDEVSTQGAEVGENTTAKLERCMVKAEKRSEASGVGSFIDDTVSDVMNGGVSVSKIVDDSGDVQYEDLPKGVEEDVKQCMK